MHIFIFFVITTIVNFNVYACNKDSIMDNSLQDICYTLNHLKIDDGSLDDYEKVVQALCAHNASVHECVRMYWDNKEAQELENIAKSAAHEKYRHGLWQTFETIRNRQYIEKVSCDNNVSPEMCEFITQQVRDTQKQRINDSRTGVPATLHVIAHDNNEVPTMNVYPLEVSLPVQYTLDIGRVEKGGEETRDTQKAKIRHELVHMWYADSLSGSLLRPAAGKPIMRLLRLHEKRADSISIHNAQDALDMHRALAAAKKNMKMDHG